MKLHALFALALFGGLSVPAHASEPTKVSAPSTDVADLLAKGKAALGAEQQAALATAVADAQQRLVANESAATGGKAERIAVDAAIAAALVDAGLAGGGKAKSKLLTVYTALATMQLAFDLHGAVRERNGRRLAIAAVRACKGEVACTGAITPTADMTADHIAAALKTKDLDAQDRIDQFELQTFSSVVSRVKTSDKMQKAVLDFVKG